MATYAADTDLARELADTFIAASGSADEIGASTATALGLSDMTSDAVVRSDTLSDLLNRGGVVIRHQADLLDGIELDVEALADDLDQDPDRLAEQLRLMGFVGIGAGAGILPLVLWDGRNAPEGSLREVFVGLPPPGESTDLDAALERLDGWLFPALINGRNPQVDALSDERLADLALLGRHLGAGERIVAYTERRSGRRNGDDYVEIVELRASVDELGGQHLLDFVTEAFLADAALASLGAIPRFEDLIDTLVARNDAEYQRLRQEILDTSSTGDSDDRRDRESRLRRLDDQFDRLDRADLLDQFGDLGWLGAVLAGVALPPTDPAARALLVEFTGAAGLTGPDVDFDRALTSLQHQRLIQEELVLDDPTDGRLIFNDELIGGTVEAGLRAGAIDDSMVADADRVAGVIVGFGPNGGDRSTMDLDGPPGEFDPAHLVQALAVRVDHTTLTENQLVAALAWVGASTTLGQQLERLSGVVLSFQTVSVAGPAVMTTHQLRRGVGSDVWDFLNSRAFQAGRSYKEGDDWKMDYSHIPSHLEGRTEQWDWVMDNLGVPGYHKERWGSRRLHLGIDGTGQVAGFQVEKIRKRGWLSTVVMAAFTLVAGFTGQWYMVYALAAKAAMDGYETGGWLGALTGAASTVLLAAGGASLSAWLAPGAIAGVGTAGASTAVTGAKVVSAGIGAHQAIENDDVVGGVVAGTRALSIGAEYFGAIDTAANLTGLADTVEGVDRTIEGIDDGDWADIVAGVATAGSGAIRLSGGAGVVPDDLVEDFDRAAVSLDRVAETTTRVDATVEAIERGDVAGAVGNGLGAVSAGARLFTDGTIGAEVLGLDESQRAAVTSLANIAEGAGTLTGSIDAAVRGEILQAVELLSQAVVDVEGGPESSVVGHHAEQLRSLLRVAGVLADVDGSTTFVELADALAPAVTDLGLAGEPAPEGVPLVASPVFDGVAIAGEAVWDALTDPIVEPIQTGDGSEVIVVVGGFGDSINERAQGDLSERLAADNPDAEVLFVSWDGDEEAARHIEDFRAEHPEADVRIVGHSWGGDAAMDIAAQIPDVDDIEVVTLDPVSWSQSPRPDNVSDWVNVHVPGINSFDDLVAAIGGHWGEQPDADLSIVVPDDRLTGDRPAHHGFPERLYNLYQDRLIEPHEPAGPKAGFIIGASGTDGGPAGGGVGGPRIPAGGGDGSLIDVTDIHDPFTPVGPQPDPALVDLTELHDPFTQPAPGSSLRSVGPPAKAGPFTHASQAIDRSGVSYHSGPVTVTGGTISENQVGYNGEVVTDVSKDGTFGRATVTGRIGTASISHQSGQVDIDTSGPNLTGEASGRFDATKVEGRLNLAQRKGELDLGSVEVKGEATLSVGANVNNATSEVDYRESWVEADGSQWSEVGSLTQHDVTIHGVVAGEAEATATGGPLTGSAAGRLQAELGGTRTTEHREAILTSSADPAAHSEKISDTTIYSIDGLAFGDVRGTGPTSLGLTESGRLAGSAAGQVWEEEAIDVVHHRNGSETGGTSTYRLDGVFVGERSTENYELDADGGRRSSSTARADGVLTTTTSTTTVDVDGRGAGFVESVETVDGIIDDEVRHTITRHVPGTGTYETETVVRQGPFGETTTTDTTFTPESPRAPAPSDAVDR